LPTLIQGVAAEHPQAARVELWFEDEARIGQKGRTTHVWYQKGVRPPGVREHRFASVHLFGAVCPERDAGVALVLPEVSTAAMNLFSPWRSWRVPCRPGPTPCSPWTGRGGTSAPSSGCPPP
jgi:hypothetical protein